MRQDESHRRSDVTVGMPAFFRLRIIIKDLESMEQPTLKRGGLD